MFRSSTMTTLTQEELIKKMAEFNTTITEADTLAVLNVLKRLVLEYTEQGYTVQTPLGLFYASASGTTNDVLADFSPQDASTDHTIRMLYRPSSEVTKGILKNTPVERSSDKLKATPFIQLVRNAGGDEDSAIKAGDSILVAGEYLKFDSGDNKQGIFLSGATLSYRLSYYTRNTDRTLEARIDSSVPAGRYTLSVKNIPTVTPVTTAYKDFVTVSA